MNPMTQPSPAPNRRHWLLGVAATPSLPLSCEGQAARLIAEASDHDNLGRMYIWWMPWL